jgi:membrane protease subunit HflK
MAWNEPGNNGNGPKDPWGGGGNDGPPDLDEAFRKLQERFGGVLGGGGNSGGQGFNAGSFGAFIVVVALVWAMFGFYQVDEQERAVVLRLGKYHSTELPGLRWNPRFIDQVSSINVTRVQSHRHEAEMLTEDENIVDVSLSVQFKVADPKDYLLQVRNPQDSLAQATESALRHVVGGSEMRQVLTEGREQIAVETQVRLQGYLDSYRTGIEVIKVNIDSTSAPDEVQAAFDDVIKAKEDEVRLKNEAEAYSNGIIPEARGYAQRQLEEANAYKEQVIAQSEGEAERFEKLLSEYRKAPTVTRERLYLDAVQNIMENSSKVMVDVEGGNNMLYLPLDKIIEQGRVTASQKGRDINNEIDIRELTDRVINQIRRQSNSKNSQSSRRREGR